MNERVWTRRKITNKRESGDNKAHAFKRLLAMRNNKFSKGKFSEDCAGKTEASNYCNAQKRKEVNIMGIETCSGDSSPHSEWENVSQNVPPEKFKNEAHVFDREQLSRAVIKRNEMENLLEKSIFEETVTGSFVRLSVGKIYCIYEIIDLNHDRKVSRVGSKHTNLVLTLRCGSEKRYSRIDMVSNQPITQKEFLLWLATNLRDRHILPKLCDIAKKQVQIKKACKYKYPEADVEKLIQTKRKAGLEQNVAYRKIRLIIERDVAAGKDDVGKVQALEKEIQEIDEEHRLHIENSGQHRYPVISSSRVVHKPTIYRDELGVAPRGKSSFGKRSANPNQLKLEQYMRRKYKKSVVVSRSRLDEELYDQEKVSSTTIHEIPTEKEKKEGEAETEKKKGREEYLHLQKLNTFKIELDTTGLIPFNEIFTNVKFDSPWDEIMKGN
ncbi:RNA polymerase-associated protein Rtf1-like isoform X1 [Drosophila teissieri]|uniref:RNA polymerase-associated protein Rtf1-like isoform X1 n=1 Tax=Drosophila teissieri TaxID=7243 RepID=UPI001CBA1607|nr:RNA polymerase-associated protein Rtf1-like isoform X1 [Drosophila teissieri]